MRQIIVEAAIAMAEKKGIKFTLADIAAELKISKKTIYAYFSGKKELIGAAVDYIFDDIHRQSDGILRLDTGNLDKLREIVSVYPAVINFDRFKLNKLLKLYPDIFAKITARLDADWEQTFDLYEKCVQEGSLKDIPREYFRAVMLGIFEQCLYFEDHKQATKICVDAALYGFTKEVGDENKG